MNGASSGAQDAEIFDGKIELPNKQLKVLVEKYDANSGSCSPSPGKRGKFQEEETRKKTQLIGRKEQFRLLDRLFGKGPGCTLPGCVFLWGAPASGKSYTLELVLEGKDLHVLRISCAEILCGRRAFYETLVKQLVSNSSTALDPSFKCDSLHLLYSNFYEFLSDDTTDRSLRVVVVVEGAENLRGEYDDILRFLVSLQDILQFAVCVVFISTLPPRQYMPNIMDHSIIPLYFPQYSMEELTQILTMNRRSGDGANSFYDFYIKMIVNMFYYACRDLRKLSRLANSH